MRRDLVALFVKQANQIFLDHVEQRVTLDVFSMTARKQTFRIEIRCAAQLYYSLRDLIRVSLLLNRVLQKLGGDTICMNSGSHEMVAPVAQHNKNTNATETLARKV